MCLLHSRTMSNSVWIQVGLGVFQEPVQLTLDYCERFLRRWKNAFIKTPITQRERAAKQASLSAVKRSVRIPPSEVQRLRCIAKRAPGPISAIVNGRVFTRLANALRDRGSNIWLSVAPRERIDGNPGANKARGKSGCDSVNTAPMRAARIRRISGLRC